MVHAFAEMRLTAHPPSRRVAGGSNGSRPRPTSPISRREVSSTYSTASAAARPRSYSPIWMPSHTP
eukprot:scaffold22672_cov108-Isochrysis_galbana.AAC.2